MQAKLFQRTVPIPGTAVPFLKDNAPDRNIRTFGRKFSVRTPFRPGTILAIIGLSYGTINIIRLLFTELYHTFTSRESVTTKNKSHMDKKKLTAENGRPIADNQNIQTAGKRGPVTLQDPWFLEKLAHFDREVTPSIRRQLADAREESFGY